jgi:hypothetical protein
MRPSPAIGLIFGFIASTAVAAECTATSAARRVPLLELYTSEGCNSCPPADRWVSALPQRGYTSDRVVVLAFHVDYWDRLGWPDRFAQPRFTERQRLVNQRGRSPVIYTPQLVFNGSDYRRGMRDDFAERLAALARDIPKAALHLNFSPAERQWTVAGRWSAAGAAQAQAWVALYENNLVTDVRAGENRDKRLRHDFVVRDVAGPFPSGSFSHVFTVDPGWKRRDLSIAAYVQDAMSGDVLQALAAPGCS